MLQAAGNGGGFWVSSYGLLPPPEFNMTNMRFISNSATGSGGAAMVFDGTELDVSNSVFEGNLASDGGALALDARSIGVLKNCSFNRNEVRQLF